MKVLRGEFLRIGLELGVAGLPGHPFQVHVFKLTQQISALAKITCDAGGHDILPIGLAVTAARDDVVKGELMGREAVSAILTRKIITHEDVEPREGRFLHSHRLILFETNNARQREDHAGASDADIVRSNDGDPVQKHSLDDVLPRP